MDKSPTERCNFIVGQKVVCCRRPVSIEGNVPASRRVTPNIGTVYTVSGIVPEDGYIFLVLRELPRFVYCDFRGFKPLETRKTDISIFTEIARDISARDPKDWARERVKELRREMEPFPPGGWLG